MFVSEASEEELRKVHQDLCMKLSLDPTIAASSWDTYESISKKFNLEGEKIHWLGCAIYVASRGIETPVSDNPSVVRGTGIKLTNLLRHSNLSLLQFFLKITRWCEMAQLPDEFRNKISNLRSNFSVAYNTFKKFHPLFTEIFVSPVSTPQDLEGSKYKNRKNRVNPCTSPKVFEFIWNMFITIKAEETSCTSQLIKSHHLLYCCIDLAFKNAVAAERKDLINSCLAEELFQEFDDIRALKEVPCIVKRFCDCSSVIKEALHMKLYTFRPLVVKLIDNNTLIADETDLTGLFDPENFDQNFRNISKAYDNYLSSHGDFDERIFLAEFKRVWMEKEQYSSSWTSMKTLPAVDSGDTSLLESPKVGAGSGAPKGLATPLTGRRFLGPRENDSTGRSTSEKISRLHNIIGDRNPSPSENLRNIFESCHKDPLPIIETIISNMKSQFLEAYATSSFSIEEAENRADLGVTLFYKYVEMILQREKKVSSDISGLVEKEIFYQCLYSCCLEIVLYCYNFPGRFPWILEVMGVEPVHFVKVIELIVRTKDCLFRELIKHLNRVEETIIESLAWKSNSPIWEAIEKSGQGIPKFQDTALPGHLLYNDTSSENLIYSPGPPSASDCFQSPPLSQLCRNLFPSSGSTAQRPIIKFMVDTDKKVDSPNEYQTSITQRRTGSVSIIFRKFYNLAGVRMQHLCSNLGFLDIELRRKIWTIFEDSIRHTDLIKDRHLDQLLMCAIYVICKAGNVNKMSNLFSVIMKFYRQQPQSSSSVYRDVLIEREKIDENGVVVPEERRDLIHFYNSVYVTVMQTYAKRFQPNKNPNSNFPLSPLPAIRKNLVSSDFQVGDNVFVKPLDTSPSIQGGSTFNYYFSRSPSKDLMNINKAINDCRIQGKRLIDEDGNMASNKRISNRKLQSLMEDRQRQNASE